MITRNPVDEAVHLMLQAALASKGPVGLAEVPETELTRDDYGRLTKPYFVLYPIPGAVGHVTLEDPEASLVLEYQVTAVGQRRDQAQMAGDACRRSVTLRDPNGEFTNPITLAGASVIDRRLGMIGGSEPGEGGLWQSVNSFDLEVST